MRTILSAAILAGVTLSAQASNNAFVAKPTPSPFGGVTLQVSLVGDLTVPADSMARATSGGTVLFNTPLPAVSSDGRPTQIQLGDIGPSSATPVHIEIVSPTGYTIQSGTVAQLITGAVEQMPGTLFVFGNFSPGLETTVTVDGLVWKENLVSIVGGAGNSVVSIQTGNKSGWTVIGVCQKMVCDTTLVRLVGNGLPPIEPNQH